MATNQTTNYQLNQWEPTDAVQRVEFNQDNAKVDAALKALSDQVVQKANQSALNTVISAVNQKADASTFTGTGTSGSGNPTRITFSHLPVLFLILRARFRHSLRKRFRLADNIPIHIELAAFISPAPCCSLIVCPVSCCHNAMPLSCLFPAGLSPSRREKIF